jgi:hypothetical protein
MKSTRRLSILVSLLGLTVCCWAQETLRVGSAGTVDVEGATNPTLTVRDTSNSIAFATQIFGGALGLLGTTTNHPFSIMTNATSRMRFAASGEVGIGTDSPVDLLHVDRAFTDLLSADDSLSKFSYTTKQAKNAVLDRRHGIFISGADDSNVNQLNVTGATNANPIVITTAAVHGYATGDRIIIDGVGGNTAANGSWAITVLSTTTFSLDGSTGNGAYTSGGIATNRSPFNGMNIYLNPLVARGGISSVFAADDTNGVMITNIGAFKTTDAIFIGASGNISGPAWDTVFAAQANATNGMQLLGDYSYGIDLNGTYSTAAIRVARSNVSKFSVVALAGSTQITTNQTTQPVCGTNCGTSPSIVGSDTAMTVTLGTTPASGFVITFNGTWSAAPSCTGAMAKAGMVVGKLPLTLVTTTTTLTVVTNGTAPATADKYHFHCIGTQ